MYVLFCMVVYGINIILKGIMTRKNAAEYRVDTPNNWIGLAPPDVFNRRLIVLRIAISINLLLGFNRTYAVAGRMYQGWAR